MKVSDEFTVPLCNTHHDQLHRIGDERAFWARNGISRSVEICGSALAGFARSTQWSTTASNGTLDPDLEAEFNEPYWRKEGSWAAAR